MRSEWETLVDDERGTLRLEFNRKMAFIHVRFRKAMEGMRAAKELLPSVLSILRGMGYKRAHVIIPDGNDALYRFETSFGFRECRRAGGNILMHQEI